MESPSTRSHSLEVIDVIEETAEAVSVVFSRPEGETFAYLPGQFLTLRVPGTPEDGTSWAPRCYSLSSTPAVDPHLQVTIKRTAGGYASNWLCDNAKPGLVLESLTPGGRFIVSDDPDELVLLAAGSGITPVLSILRSELTGSSASITLIYANRDRNSIIFDSALAQLEATYPNRLRVTHWLESERGLPDAAGLRSAFPASTITTSAYLCGPTGFMDAAVAAAVAAGIDRARIHREAFASLTTDPFDEPSLAPDSSNDVATVTVTLDGTTATLPWPTEQVLLDTLLAAGLDAPYVCREGNCGGCAFKLLDGEVRMLINDALDDYEIGSGVRLACQSVPCVDEITVEFD
ncbi:2Fe-2S iron-sulfur cluster-binding protein [Gordonia sp. CPCC 205333]|uniref:2Fe-2S iron-sulfur cluster-binding protein n=1 Tax=Gordonia sp. CPCC 205333 TaxID=3140790 RepID=UPI003AF4013F